MSNAFSLSTSGSMPSVPSSLSKPYAGPAISVGAMPGKQVNQTGLTNDGTNSPVKLPTTTVPLTSGMLPSSAPKATTPLASTTITDPAGNTVKHTYQTTPSTGSSYAGPSYAGLVGTDARVTPSSTPTVSAGLMQNSNPSTTNSSNTVQTADAHGNPLASTTYIQPNPNGSSVSQANAYQNAGAMTPNETAAQQNLYNAGQMTPFQNQEANEVQQAQQLNNINTLSPYADAQFYGGGGQQVAPDLAAPDLAGRAAGTSALANSLGNIFGSASTAGLAAANSIAQQRLGAAENIYSGSQTQAGRENTDQGDIFKSSLGIQASPTNVSYNALTNTYGPTASNAYGSGGLASVGALQQQQSQGADVQTMQSALNQSSGLITKAKQDIASSGFNSSPIPLANALQQYLNTGVVSNPTYSNVINDLTEIASTIAPVLGTPGNPSDLKTTISQELIPRLMQGQDLSSVLDNIESNANIKINAAKTSASTNAVNAPTSSSSVSNWTFGLN